MKTILLSMAILLATMPSAQAQYTDFQTWGQFTSTINLDAEKKWFIFIDAHGRLGDDNTELERTLLGPALGYRLNSNFSFLLGYSWAPTYINSSYQSNFADEHRILPQVVFNHDLLGLSWSHRLMHEVRFIDKVSTASNRTRYLLRGSHSINDTFGLSAYSEPFVNLHGASRGPKGGMDRWRFFAGPYWKREGVRYEIGYLGELGQGFRDDDRMINGLFLGVHLNNDLGLF